jgi:hypothetical protein
LLVSGLIFSSSTCSEDETGYRPPATEIPRATHIYPPKNSKGHSRTPLFFWDGHAEESGDGSFAFTIEVKRMFSSGIWTIPVGSDTTFQFPDTLESETDYSWTITTESDDGKTATSSITMFTTGTDFNNPPRRVEFTYPWDVTIIQTDIPLDAVLTWYCVDPDGDDLTFDLWHHREQDVDTVYVPGLTSMEYSTPLDADTRYSFAVRAYDEYGSTTYRSYILFHTISTSPPHAPSPADGETDIPLDIILSWSCTDPDGDDLTYDVEMGRAGGSMSSIGTGLTQDELPVVGLSDGVTYEWKVTAEDDDAHRTEGPVWTFTTVGAPGDVFADLTLTRKQTSSITEVVVIDNILARFDEEYAPQYWIRPLQPDAVTCGGFDLGWQDSRNRYYYENAHTLTFLVPGNEYTFSITGGDGVPSLTESIVFPQCAPLITSPLAFDPVSMDGFTVTWSGYDDFTDCDRQVSIAILDIMGDSTGVYVTTENDGSYTFTAGELSVIDPSIMDMQIVLIVENVMNIDSPGYDPRSWIRARTLTVQNVYAQ